MSDKIFQLTEGLFRDTPEELLAASVPTYLGMAHFAGSGPVGKTCRECAFWLARHKWIKGEPAAARCRKHRQFTMKHRGPGVPHSARACKYFEQAEAPQPLERP